MKYVKVSLFIGLSLLSKLGLAQYEIKPQEGYSPQIGIMVAMLEDMKGRIAVQVKDLSLEETDFLFDDKANSIGALMMHLIATESYYQVESLEGRHWTEAEKELFDLASELGDSARERFKGKPISYYLELWDEVRAKSLAGLQQKDDHWFASNIDEGMNYHFVWYHVLEHSANHMGQIALVKNRLPK